MAEVVTCGEGYAVVLSGELELGDCSTHALGPGGLARVDPSTRRKLRSTGDRDGVYLIVGAEGGYLGRDGLQPEREQHVRQVRGA